MAGAWGSFSSSVCWSLRSARWTRRRAASALFSARPLLQRQPTRLCSEVARDVGEFGLGVEIGGDASELEGEAGDAFELAAGQAGAIGGEENACAGGGDFEGGLEQRFEVAFDLKAATLVAARECGW